MMAAERDYQGELIAYIGERLPDGDYVAAIAADELVHLLRDEDPDLLDGWLRQRAPQLVAGVIRGLRGQERTRLLKKPPSSFQRAADAHAGGDDKPLRDFMERATYRVRGNIIRKLGDMTAADCRHVAAAYRSEADTLGFEAVFMDVLATKVGARKVRDVLTETQIQQIRDNIRLALGQGAA